MAHEDFDQQECEHSGQAPPKPPASRKKREDHSLNRAKVGVREINLAGQFGDRFLQLPARGRQRVLVVFGKFSASLPIPVVGSRNPVVDSYWTVPWQSEIVFGVAVEPEQLAVRIERDIVSVPRAARKQLAIISVEVHAQDKARRRRQAEAEALRVFITGQQLVICVIPQWRS